MKRDEVIMLAEEWLKSVPDLEEHIRLIDTSLKKSSYDKVIVDKLKLEKDKLQRKLSRIIMAVSTLEYNNQRIICYRYFDKLNYSQIYLRVALSNKTIPRRIGKSLLKIGRVMFRIEDEFWRKII